MRGTFFVICGPSGGGKTTVVSLLLSRMVQRLQRVVTYTTRKPGAKELNGVDYHFIDEEEFKAKIDQRFFLEWSTTYKAWYGTPRTVLTEIEKGSSFIAILDRKGAAAVKQECPTSCLVGLYPPSIEVLEQRLRMRGRDSSDAIEARLELARIELQDEHENPLFDYHVLNDTLTTAVEIIEKIVHKKLLSEKSLLKNSAFFEKIFKSTI